MYVKFIENQLEKPAVVVRLTNQLGKALSLKQQERKRGHYYLKTVSPPLDTFMKARKAKML
jgi:hypothetical protein